MTNPTVTLPVDEYSQLRILIRDANATPLLTTPELLGPQPGPLVTTGYSLGEYFRVGQGGGGLVIPVVNWDDSTFSNNHDNNGDYYYGESHNGTRTKGMFSGDGKVMLIGSYINSVSGRLKVYEYMKRLTNGVHST